MFYTPDTLTVSEGEVIAGTLSCAPNARNNRDLDITIAYETPKGGKVSVDYKMCVRPSFLSSPPPSPRRRAGEGAPRTGGDVR